MQQTELQPNDGLTFAVPRIDFESLTAEQLLEFLELQRAARQVYQESEWNRKYAEVKEKNAIEVQRYEQQVVEINKLIDDVQLHTLLTAIFKSIVYSEELDIVNYTHEEPNLNSKQISVKRGKPSPPNLNSDGSLRTRNARGVIVYSSVQRSLSVRFSYDDNDVCVIDILIAFRNKQEGPNKLGSTTSIQELKQKLFEYLVIFSYPAHFDSADFYSKFEMKQSYNSGLH